MHIVFVGLAGVPRLSRACDVRLSFFANLLAREHEVTILNRYSSSAVMMKMDVALDTHVSIKEIITPRKSEKIRSLVLFILSILIEPYKLLSICRRKKINVLHIYSSHYLDYLLYWIIGRLIGAKIVAQYVEFRSDHKGRMTNPYHRINGYLCDYWGPKLWDGVIPISDFLQDWALKRNPKLKYQKVTPICDFAVIEHNQLASPIEGDYLLYCGNVGYKWAADLIIDSYKQSIISKSVKLVLVLSGNREKIEEQRKNNPDITILTRLDYDELIACYKHAKGLFIPLKDEIREIARFPNKVCEYLACHGLIITTNVGEMSNYFKDGQNAIIADDFSTESLCAKLNSLAQGKYDIDQIKTNAYYTGLLYFNIDSYKSTASSFFDNLVQ